MATNQKSVDAEVSGAWKRIDAFLMQQMQQVDNLMQESSARVAQISLASAPGSAESWSPETTQAEESNMNYLDDTAQKLRDNVNRAMDKAMTRINEQVEIINKHNRL